MPVDRTSYPTNPSVPVPCPSTVDADGTPKLRMPEGGVLRPLRTHIDARGSLTEFFDARWDIPGEDVLYGEFVTFRPDVVKGWARHRHKTDRHFVMLGDIQCVLYDDRPDSATKGLITDVTLGPTAPQLLVIPPMVWHAFRNLSSTDALLVGIPDRVYDHEAPDKEVLPVTNEIIPYRFA